MNRYSHAHKIVTQTWTCNWYSSRGTSSFGEGPNCFLTAEYLFQGLKNKLYTIYIILS